MRDTIFALLHDLRGLEPLKRLFWQELNYDRMNTSLPIRDWAADAHGRTQGSPLQGDPLLLAEHGDFKIIYGRMAGDLNRADERTIINKLLQNYPYALFVFSDNTQTHWHFVNVKYDRDTGKRRVFRRITVEPGERLRTAAERLSMLDLETVSRDLFGIPALAIQQRHDQAFDVEAVTREFFREYDRLFKRAEAHITALPEERRRLFTQKLFNRLMFIAFLERKGWLRFNGRTDYLRALWDAYQATKQKNEEDNFYWNRLYLLFFSGLNYPYNLRATHGTYLNHLIGDVPYLNGGLFEREDDDENRTIQIPDTVFEAIINDLFYRYNFTVAESTPLDVEVAVDPEMLGKVFEELVTGRHETGSYYTPKPVVAFMCREALKGYLRAALPHEQPHTIAQFVDDYDASNLRDPEAALQALRRITVCDPACGSGAYLLGMLHELLHLRASLFTARHVDPRSIYDRKLEIIQNNIYGVDLDPFAVNIARLRLWLSLIVDFELGREGEELPTLPNLDYKIEVGDSLLAPDPSGGIQPDMFRKQQIEDYFATKEQFLKAHGEEKKRLHAEVERLQREIKEWARGSQPVDAFDWAIEFAEVFDDGGFDVVLANPPYVRQELIKAIKPALKQVYTAVYNGTADLYTYFYARAVQMLKPGGMLAFISSNKWFRANYGANLRRFLAEQTSVWSITDFGELPVFQTAATFPMIFVAQKHHDRTLTDRRGGSETRDNYPLTNRRGGSETRPCVDIGAGVGAGLRPAPTIHAPTIFTQVKSLGEPYPDVAALVAQHGQPLPSDAISGDTWTLTDAATAERLRRMEQAGLPLGEYVKGKIYRGVLTGFNTAFVINGATRAALIAQDPSSAEIIKPLAVGDDVRKWRIENKDRWLIVTPIGVNIKRYPAVFAHLQQWQKELEKRYDKGKYWWELRTCDYYAEFDKPKIVFPDIAKASRFAFDAEGMYINNTTYFIPKDDLYLLSVLNSQVMWFYCKERLTVLGDADKGGRLRFFRQFVEKLPIPNAPAAERDAIAALARRCLDRQGMHCEAEEREIDARVARLYGVQP